MVEDYTRLVKVGQGGITEATGCIIRSCGQLTWIKLKHSKPASALSQNLAKSCRRFPMTSPSVFLAACTS
eukprot:11465818-Karenia_brevis.AAC.1